MAYTPTVWKNGVAGGTPLSAVNLNKLTDEIAAQAQSLGISHTLPFWQNGSPPAITSAGPLNEIERVVDLISAVRGNSYSPTQWQEGWIPARNATNLNKLENATALNSTTTPPTSVMLDATRATLDPGEVAIWSTYDSSTSLIWGAGSRDKHRNVKWAAFSGDGGRPSFYSGRRMFALMGFRLITGYPNRTFNWHSVPHDLPDGWSAGGTSCNAAQVSPLAIDITSGGAAVKLKAQKPGCANPNNIGPAAESWTFMSGPELEARRNQWVWWWMEVGLGNNYEPPGGGYVKVWLAGENSTRLSISTVNTHWIREHVVSLWEGCYWSSGSSGTTVIETAATRLGRTPQECFYDTPTIFSRESAGNANGPGGSGVAIGDVDGGGVAVPTSLQW